MEEGKVLAVVRAWFDHDVAGRQGSLPVLLPLIRWPLLPLAVRLALSKERLLVCLLRLDDEARTLGMQLLTECLSAEFAQTDAAVACPRLKRRKGAVLPLAWTGLSQDYYSTSEDGALLTSTGYPDDRAALCRERVMNSGQSCAEVTVVQRGHGHMLIGVGRPTLDVNAADADESADFWAVGSYDGKLYHNGNAHDWQGQQPYATGDVLRLLLDSDAGTLTVKKNGALLGVAVTSGLTGDLCWAVCYRGSGDSVRIKSVGPADF